jgi:hypothetical protein
LTRFGQQKPVVATRSGVVVAGNGLLAAARSLGWKRLAAIVIDTDDPDEVMAFALADNRTAELSRWDGEQLARTMEHLRKHRVPVVEMGWVNSEVDLLVASLKPMPVSRAEEDDDELAEVSEPEDDGRQHGFKSLTLTLDQHEVVMAAIAKVRRQEGDPEMSTGRCLELVAAEFIA